MKLYYTDIKDAIYMAKYHNFHFQTEGGKQLEFYTYNDSFRYAHPTLDEWIYPTGKFYVTDPIPTPEVQND